MTGGESCTFNFWAAGVRRLSGGAVMFEAALRCLERAGYPQPGRVLGEGVFATAYELGEHLVAKVTCDETDAAVAELARRAQLTGGCRNLMRVERVWQVQTDFLIVAERLQPIPEHLHKYLPSRLSSIECNSSNIHDVVRKWREGVGMVSTEWWYGDRATVWGTAAANILGIAEDLASIGVTRFTDYHRYNVMLRPGDRIVLSDFGFETQSPQPEIEVF